MALHNGIIALNRRDTRDLAQALYLPGKDTARRQPSVIHKESSHQNTTMLVPWPWNSQPSELWETNFCSLTHSLGLPGSLVVNNLSANTRDARDTCLIPGLGWSPGVESGNPLQYSCLENSMDRGAWQTTVHGATKSQTRPSISHTVYSVLLQPSEQTNPWFTSKSETWCMFLLVQICQVRIRLEAYGSCAGRNVST